MDMKVVILHEALAFDLSFIVIFFVPSCLLFCLLIPTFSGVSETIFMISWVFFVVEFLYDVSAACALLRSHV